MAFKVKTATQIQNNIETMQANGKKYREYVQDVLINVVARALMHGGPELARSATAAMVTKTDTRLVEEWFVKNGPYIIEDKALSFSPDKRMRLTDGNNAPDASAMEKIMAHIIPNLPAWYERPERVESVVTEMDFEVEFGKVFGRLEKQANKLAADKVKNIGMLHAIKALMGNWSDPHDAAEEGKETSAAMQVAHTMAADTIAAIAAGTASAVPEVEAAEAA